MPPSSFESNSRCCIWKKLLLFSKNNIMQYSPEKRNYSYRSRKYVSVFNNPQKLISRQNKINQWRLNFFLTVYPTSLTKCHQSQKCLISIEKENIRPYLQSRIFDSLMFNDTVRDTMALPYLMLIQWSAL